MAAHVREIAAAWHLPYYQKTAESLKKTEAAAREWRYQSLTAMAQEGGFRIVVTGHTQSDRAETLLYNLIRGAGGDGLSALIWQRLLTAEIELVRPLLAIFRQETHQFCQQLQLPVYEDASNQNLHYARNRLRQEVIPYLQTHFNPQVEKALAQAAEILRADAEYLEAAAGELLEQAISLEGKAINRRHLQAVPLALQRRTLRQFWWQCLATSPNFEQVEGLVQLIAAPNRTRTSSLPGGAMAEVRGDWIALLTKNKRSLITDNSWASHLEEK
jgi:tRNA(Ile)-lysidine synthase